jgi:hypothetical protein
MEIKGKIIAKPEMQTGTGANGDWKKQEIVVETEEKYPERAVVSFWKEKADEVAALEIGTVVTVLFNSNAREYNGKWYADNKGWKVITDDNSPPPPPDDLPFP